MGRHLIFPMLWAVFVLVMFGLAVVWSLVVHDCPVTQLDCVCSCSQDPEGH